MFSSIVIVISVFISYSRESVIGSSIFSMNLFDYNKKEAVVLIVLGVLAFAASYTYRGFVTSLLGIIILVANIAFYIHINTGYSVLDQNIQVVKSYLGSMGGPRIGFWIIAGSSLLLFVAGILINKGIEREKQKKQSQV